MSRTLNYTETVMDCDSSDDCLKLTTCSETQPCIATDNYCYGMEKGWAWLGWLVIWFIIFTVIFWLIFYSLQPYFVINNSGTGVDNAKVLLAALIVALILVIIIWLIKTLVMRRGKL